MLIDVLEIEIPPNIVHAKYDMFTVSCSRVLILNKIVQCHVFVNEYYLYTSM